MSSEGWETHKLGYLLGEKGYVRGPFGSSLKRGEMKPNGIPVYEQQHAIYNNRDFRYYIDEEKFLELRRFQVKTNDLIVSCSGTIGKISIISGEDPKGIISQALLILRPDNTKVLPEYLKYYFTTREGYNNLVSTSHGSVQINIASRDVVENITIEVPDIPTQHRIAEILSALDDKIELNRQTNATLEAIAQAIFKEWFVDFNFPGATGEMIESELGMIPRGWHVGELGDIVDIKGGTTPSTKVENFWEGEFHWATPKDLSNLKSNILLTTEKKITREGVTQISSGILPKGTLLLSSRAPIGYLAITNIPVSINQGFIAINSMKTSNYFMLHWLKKNMETVISRANGSTFLEISKTNFKQIDLIIPDEITIQRFDDFYGPIFNQILINEQQCSTCAQIRDSLLPKLMSGEIEV